MENTYKEAIQRTAAQIEIQHLRLNCKLNFEELQETAQELSRLKIKLQSLEQRQHNLKKSEYV